MVTAGKKDKKRERISETEVMARSCQSQQKGASQPPDKSFICLVDRLTPFLRKTVRHCPVLQVSLRPVYPNGQAGRQTVGTFS